MLLAKIIAIQLLFLEKKEDFSFGYKLFFFKSIFYYDFGRIYVIFAKGPCGFLHQINLIELRDIIINKTIKSGNNTVPRKEPCGTNFQLTFATELLLIISLHKSERIF